MNEYEKMCNNPHNNPMLLMTECCEANFDVIPACFGDPEIYVCSKCSKMFTDNNKLLRVPMFKKIRNGVYRPIVYPNLQVLTQNKQ